MPKRAGRKRYLAHVRFLAGKRRAPRGLDWLLQQEADAIANAETRAREALPVLLREPPRVLPPWLRETATPPPPRNAAKPRIVAETILETRISYQSALTVEPYVPERVIPGPPPPDIPYVPSGPPTSIRDLTEPDTVDIAAPSDTAAR